MWRTGEKYQCLVAEQTLQVVALTSHHDDVVLIVNQRYFNAVSEAGFDGVKGQALQQSLPGNVRIPLPAIGKQIFIELIFEPDASIFTHFPLRSLNCLMSRSIAGTIVTVFR